MFDTRQIVGNRAQQEDSFHTETIELPHRGVMESANLFVVADGMGGHCGGEVASRLAVEAFTRSLTSGSECNRERLAAALQDANQSIAQEALLDRSLAGMGTTLLGVLRRGNSLNWASVGDSLLLLFRESRLRRLNEDHSLLPELMAAAEARGQDRDIAYRDSRRHRLRSALTGMPPTLIDMADCELRPDDLVIIASDGIATLSLQEIEELLVGNQEKFPSELTELIMGGIEARKASHQDNVTLIVYRHAGLPGGNPTQPDWHLL